MAKQHRLTSGQSTRSNRRRVRCGQRQPLGDFPRPGDSPRRRTRRRESNIFRRGNGTLGICQGSEAAKLSPQNRHVPFFCLEREKPYTPLQLYSMQQLWNSRKTDPIPLQLSSMQQLWNSILQLFGKPWDSMRLP